MTSKHTKINLNYSTNLTQAKEIGREYLRHASQTAAIQGRQCGKTAALEISHNMERAIFNLQRDKDLTPVRIEVDVSLLHALKLLPTVFDTYAAEGQPDKIYGIPVKVNEILPPGGYAFIDLYGNVVAAGTVNVEGKA